MQTAALHEKRAFCDRHENHLRICYGAYVNTLIQSMLGNYAITENDFVAGRSLFFQMRVLSKQY